MFGYELKSKTRKETIDEILSIIDKELETCKELRDEYCVKVEGYAHSKDVYQASYAMSRVNQLNDRIGGIDLVRQVIVFNM